MKLKGSVFYPPIPSVLQGFKKIIITLLFDMCGCFACIYVCVSHTCIPGARGSQKRVSGPLRMELQQPCGCWDFNSCALEEQPML